MTKAKLKRCTVLLVIINPVECTYRLSLLPKRSTDTWKYCLKDAWDNHVHLGITPLLSFLSSESKHPSASHRKSDVAMNPWPPQASHYSCWQSTYRNHTFKPTKHLSASRIQADKASIEITRSSRQSTYRNHTFLSSKHPSASHIPIDKTPIKITRLSRYGCKKLAADLRAACWHTYIGTILSTSVVPVVRQIREGNKT